MTVCSDYCCITLTQWENHRVTSWSQFHCRLKIWDHHPTNYLMCVCVQSAVVTRTTLRVSMFFALYLSHFCRNIYCWVALKWNGIWTLGIFTILYQYLCVYSLNFDTVDLSCLRCWDCSILCSRLYINYSTANVV